MRGRATAFAAIAVGVVTVERFGRNSPLRQFRRGAASPTVVDVLPWSCEATLLDVPQWSCELRTCHVDEWLGEEAAVAEPLLDLMLCFEEAVVVQEDAAEEGHVYGSGSVDGERP